jgi:hypothetical protein
MMNDKYTQSADFQAIVKNGVPDSAISALAFFCSLRSQKNGECGSFFGLCPKKEPLLLFFASEASKKQLWRLSKIDLYTLKFPKRKLLFPII